MTFATVGTPSAALGSTLTMTCTTVKIGNFLLLGWTTDNGIGQVTGATSSNAVWSVLVPGQYNASVANRQSGVLLGIVTAVGSATLTFQTSGTVTQVSGQSQEFSTTEGLASLRVDSRGIYPQGSGNLNFPVLLPYHGAGELYFCFSQNGGAYTAGSTTGFSYNVDSSANMLVWNPNCSNASQAPTAGSSTGVGFGIGMLLWEQNGLYQEDAPFTLDQVAQPTFSPGTSGTVVVTFPTTPTPGSKVILSISESGASNITSAVDNGTRPTNFNVDNFAFNGAQHCFIVRGDNITLPLTGPYQVTITFTANAFASCFGASWLGLAAGGPSAGSGGVFNTGSGANLTSNSVTPPSAGCLLISNFNTNSGSNPEKFFVTNPGWISLGQSNNGSLVQCGMATYAASWASTAITATATVSDTPGWEACLSCYSPATNTIQPNAGLIEEMQLGGTWTDVSNWVMQRDAITVSRGRQNEASGMQAGNKTATLKNQDGRFSLRNPSSPYWGQLLQNVPIRASIPSFYGGIPSYMRMAADDISGAQAPDVVPIQIVNYTAGTAFASSGTSKSQTIPATIQGSTLIAVVAYGNTGWTQSITSITTTAGAQTFNKVSANQSFDSYTSIWELPNCAVGTTSVVANFSAACFGNISVYEVRGLDPAGAFDRLSSNGNTGSPASSGAMGPTLQASELIIGAISCQATAFTPTGVGFTNHTAVQWGTGFDGTGDLAVDGYQIASTVGSFTYSGTFSGGSNGWTAACASFRANNNGIGNCLNTGLASNTNGIMSVVVDCKITDWQQNHVLAAKYGSIAKAWGLWTNGSGKLTFDIFDGTTDHFVFSSAPVPYYSGRIAIRVDYDITLQTVTFYTAPNAGGPWTQLGSTQTTSSTSISSANGQPIQMGFGSTNLPGMYGEIYECKLTYDAKTWDFENSAEIGDWSTNGGTLSQSVTQFNTGGNSMRLAANGTASTFVSHTFEAVGNMPAGGNAFVFSSRAQNISLVIDWFTSAGSYISTTGGSAVAVAANTWTQLTMPGVNSPSNAAIGHLYYNIPAPTNTDLIYFDTIVNYGSVVLDAIFPIATPNIYSSFCDLQGNQISIQGTAELTAKLYRFHGEWAQSPKNTDESTKDVYIQGTSYGLNQRISNANTPLNSPMHRAYQRLNPAFRLCDYWPMEEGTHATSFGSGVGGNPMTIAGNPTLASNSSFVCSAPLPVINSATFIAPVRTSNITWQDNVVRFLFSVPSSDDTNNAFFCNIYTTGTIALLRVQYGTGGVLALQGLNSSNTQVFSQNAAFGLPELANCRVSAELLNVSGTNHFALWVLTANGTTANGIAGGTFAGTIGGVTQVSIGGGLVGSAIGHLSVQGVDDGINDLINPLIGWTGETAGARFGRLCSEEGLACRIMGPPDQSQVMGVQPIDTLANILQQCEATDQGQQYEPRDALALGYRTIRGLYNQQVMSTAYYGGGDLFTGFGSTADTQLTVNDVTANAADGSIARMTMPSGFPNLSKMNTNPPNSGWPPVNGQITTPGTFTQLCATPPIAAGTYNVKWAVNLSGTTGAPEVNNFRLYMFNSLGVNIQTLAFSVQGSGANLYPQADALNVVVPAGGCYIAIFTGGNTPTSGAVYGGTILAQDPGIGSVQTSTSPNPASDTELNSHSNWTLHVRSIDDDRYPIIPFHIARVETPQSAFLLDVGDYLQIPDGPIWLPNGAIKQLAAGFQETYFPGQHGIIEINGIPELPYEVSVAGSGNQRLASAGSFVSLAYTYGNTSLAVWNYPGSLTLWTTNPSDFPFNIALSGMILQVTNITGSTLGAQQTFTVGATSLNGVVKNIPIGTPVQVASPMVVAW